MEVWTAAHDHWMSVVGQAVTRGVRPVETVSQGRVRDVFHGWFGDTVVVLENGQLWKQDHPLVRRRYVLRPDAWVFREKGEYWMEVANTRARVRPLRSARRHRTEPTP
jgi:hypothetical protein